MNQPPENPKSASSSHLQEWFHEWKMWARSSIPEWSTHEIECHAMSLDDTETPEYLSIRMLQAMLRHKREFHSFLESSTKTRFLDTHQP